MSCFLSIYGAGQRSGGRHPTWPAGCEADGASRTGGGAALGCGASAAAVSALAKELAFILDSSCVAGAAAA